MFVAANLIAENQGKNHANQLRTELNEAKGNKSYMKWILKSFKNKAKPIKLSVERGDDGQMIFKTKPYKEKRKRFAA